jgi:hypothetical protein
MYWIDEEMFIHANFLNLCGILPIWSRRKGKSRYSDLDRLQKYPVIPIFLKYLPKNKTTPNFKPKF